MNTEERLTDEWLAAMHRQMDIGIQPTNSQAKKLLNEIFSLKKDFKAVSELGEPAADAIEELLGKVQKFQTALECIEPLAHDHEVLDIVRSALDK
jgi:hypothetical protein